MPFRNRNLHMLANWEPDEDFNPTTDRLLITTNWGDTFVAYWQKSPLMTEGHLAVDMDFPPANLAQIPQLLKLYEDFHTHEDWYVFLYDGDQTASGPKLDIIALGAGWAWDIHTSLGIEHVEPVKLADIDPSMLSSTMGGIYIEESRIRVTDRSRSKQPTVAAV